MLWASFWVLNTLTIMLHVRLGQSLRSGHNFRFDLRVARLEGGCFNFRGLRLLLLLPLIVGLTSSTLAYYRPLDGGLRLNLNVPLLPRPWVGDMYLYPLVHHVVPPSRL